MAVQAPDNGAIVLGDFVDGIRVSCREQVVTVSELVDRIGVPATRQSTHVTYVNRAIRTGSPI